MITIIIGWASIWVWSSILIGYFFPETKDRYAFVPYGFLFATSVPFMLHLIGDAIAGGWYAGLGTKEQG